MEAFFVYANIYDFPICIYIETIICMYGMLIYAHIYGSAFSKCAFYNCAYIESYAHIQKYFHVYTYMETKMCIIWKQILYMCNYRRCVYGSTFHICAIMKDIYMEADFRICTFMKIKCTYN